jgi:hypothetical protein
MPLGLNVSHVWHMKVPSRGLVATVETMLLAMAQASAGWPLRSSLLAHCDGSYPRQSCGGPVLARGPLESVERPVVLWIVARSTWRQLSPIRRPVNEVLLSRRYAVRAHSVPVGCGPIFSVTDWKTRAYRSGGFPAVALNRG